MSLVIGFGVFIGAMVLCISLDYTMVIALFIGLAAFAAIGTKKGYTVRALTGMGVCGVKDAFVVVKIMCIIGFITAAWRSSGTIAFFVYYGIKLITPEKIPEYVLDRVTMATISSMDSRPPPSRIRLRLPLSASYPKINDFIRNTGAIC